MLKKIILILILYLVILQVPVYADVCTNKEMDSLRALADKIEFSKEFSLSEFGRHAFDLNAYNLTNKIYVEMPNGLQVLTNETKSYLGRFWQGQELEIYIYASENSNCGDELLKTVSIKLEKYNEYASREECKNNQKLDVCKQWTDTSEITEEEFKKIINGSNNTTNNDVSSNNIINFIKNNIIYIAIIIVVLVGVFILVKRNKDKKRIKIDF